MSSTSPNFVGNFSALDAAASLSVVGLSRIVEVAYASPSASGPIGNFVAAGQAFVSPGTGSRIVEVSYASALGN